MSAYVNNISCYGSLNLIDMSVISLKQSVDILTVSLAHSKNIALPHFTV